MDFNQSSNGEGGSFRQNIQSRERQCGPGCSWSLRQRNAEATVLHLRGEPSGALQSWPDFYALKRELPISGGKQQRAQMSLEKVLSREFFANGESSTAKLGFDANQPRSKCLLDVARYHEYLYGEMKHFFSSVLQS